METIKTPHQILIASSPKEADLAFASVDDNGRLGQLNHYVITQYGYTENDMPGAALLQNGFALLETTESKPIVFIVTVEANKSTRSSLETNLYNALGSLAERLDNTKIWLPLMGTGDGGLTLQESYEITTKSINRFLNDFPIRLSLIISLPDSEEATILRNQLVRSAYTENAGDFVRKLNANFYVAEPFWSETAPAEKFFEENTLESSQGDESYLEVRNSIKENDIIILKSAFSPVYEGALNVNVNGLGIVTHVAEDGVPVEVDWRIKNINLDIPVLGKYRRTIEQVSLEDVVTIFSTLDPVLWQELLPAPLSSSLTLDNRIAGLISDGEKGDDYLDIDKDVSAFARVMAAKSFEPPLAIALFGKWGSGKSFFMHKLREQIETLSGRESRNMYCQGVVHIHFNAWSYMDANLWASFVSRIFEGLQEYIKSENLGAEKEKSIKTTLSEGLNVTKNNIDTLKEKKEVIEKQIETLEKKRQSAQQLVTDKINELKSRTAWNIIEKLNEEFNAKNQIVAALKENDSYVKTEAELRKIIPEKYWNDPHEAYGQAKSKYTFLKEFFKRKNVTANLVWLSCILLAIFLVPGILELLGVTITRINFTFPQSVLTVLATLGFMWRQAETVYHKLQPIIASFWKIKEDYKQSKEKALAEFAQDEKALKLEIEKGKEEILLYTQQIQKAEIISAELEFKINNALASETLYTFIDERSKSDDYKKHLGIISIIRKDFEILNNLFVGHNKEMSGQADVAKFRQYFNKPVERIVLYIDDLDRCPEDNVVQVLEAVNLLMAFPLFIVVVGVDPRWVKNALIKKHTLQFAGMQNGGIANNGGIEQIEPSNYLEKIFQIPFHLKDARPQNVKEMIRQLASSKPVDTTSYTSSPAQHKSSPNIVTGTPDTPGNQDTTEQVSESVQPKDELEIIVIENIKFLELSEEEVKALEDMGEIIGPNPRAIKRFVNIFKIVKAHEDYTLKESNSREELLAVLFLLALSTGQFRCLVSSFEGYIEMPGNESRLLTSFLQNIPVGDGYQKEKNALNVILSNNNSYPVLKNLKAATFNYHNSFIKRFTFKNL